MLGIANEAKEVFTADLWGENERTTLQQLSKLSKKFLFHLLTKVERAVDVCDYVDQEAFNQI